MQNGPLLGHVDLLTAKHRGNAPAQTTLLSKAHEQSDCLLSDTILRVVEVNAGGVGREALATPGILGEELFQMHHAY
jgi:hypothetical protein